MILNVKVLKSADHSMPGIAIITIFEPAHVQSGLIYPVQVNNHQFEFVIDDHWQWHPVNPVVELPEDVSRYVGDMIEHLTK